MEVLKQQFEGIKKDAFLERWFATTHNGWYCPSCRHVHTDKGKHAADFLIQRTQDDLGPVAIRVVRTTCPETGEVLYLGDINYCVDETEPFGPASESESRTRQTFVGLPSTYQGRKIRYAAHMAVLFRQRIDGVYYSLCRDEEQKVFWLSAKRWFPYTRGKTLFWMCTSQTFKYHWDTRTAYFYDANGKTLKQCLNCSNQLPIYTPVGWFLENHPMLPEFSELLMQQVLERIGPELRPQLKAIVQKVWDKESPQLAVNFMLGFLRNPNHMVWYDSWNQRLTKYNRWWNPIGASGILDANRVFNRSRLQDSREYILEICDKYHLPTSKAFMRLYSENPVPYLGAAIAGRRLGIQNTDLLYRMIKCQTGVTNRPGNAKMLGLQNRFYKAVIRHTGIRHLLTIIESDFNRFADDWQWRDTARMYDEIGRKKPELITERFFDQHIDQMHNELTRLIERLEAENKPLTYSAKQTAYNRDCGGISFRLAKDTDELLQIGQEMDICVGSYRDVALAGESVIVSARDKDGYRACIEVAPSGALRQVKGKYNQILSGSLANAVRTWAAECKLKTACYDYAEMA